MKTSGWILVAAVVVVVGYLVWQNTQQMPGQSSTFTHTYCQQTQRCNR